MYPANLKKLETEWLKEKFEGSLLLGRKPYDQHTNGPLPGIVRHDYTETARGGIICRIPCDIWEQEGGKEVENPDLAKRAVEQIRKSRKTNTLYF